MISIKSLHIYPIKSLGGIELNSSPVERRGLQYDRRWMLIETSGRFISQRENPKLALIEPDIEGNNMLLQDKSGLMEPLSFSLSEPTSEAKKVTIWDDECWAKPLENRVNLWFSKFMNRPVELVYMHEASERIADQRYAHKADDIVSFADGYPILVISQKSLDLLSEKLGFDIPMNRFRPNIVLEGLAPNEEDTLAEIVINDLKLFGVKPCARCVMTTIDQQTGEQGKEPLRTLNTYRKLENKILFGENFIPDTTGIIGVGDEVLISKRKKALV